MYGEGCNVCMDGGVVYARNVLGCLKNRAMTWQMCHISRHDIFISGPSPPSPSFQMADGSPVCLSCGWTDVI